MWYPQYPGGQCIYLEVFANTFISASMRSPFEGKACKHFLLAFQFDSSIIFFSKDSYESGSSLLDEEGKKREQIIVSHASLTTEIDWQKHELAIASGPTHSHTPVLAHNKTGVKVLLRAKGSCSSAVSLEIRIIYMYIRFMCILGYIRCINDYTNKGTNVKRVIGVANESGLDTRRRGNDNGGSWQT